MPLLSLNCNTCCITLWLFNAVLQRDTNRFCENEYKTSLENQLIIQCNLTFLHSQISTWQISCKCNTIAKDNWFNWFLLAESPSTDWNSCINGKTDLLSKDREIDLATGNWEREEETSSWGKKNWQTHLKTALENCSPHVPKEKSVRCPTCLLPLTSPPSRTKRQGSLQQLDLSKQNKLEGSWVCYPSVKTGLLHQHLVSQQVRMMDGDSGGREIRKCPRCWSPPWVWLEYVSERLARNMELIIKNMAGKQMLLALETLFAHSTQWKGLR